jgi:hypothetical protein
LPALLLQRQVNGEIRTLAGLAADGDASAMLIDDAPAAFSTLAAAGVKIASEQEVLVVAVEDRPGILGEVSRKLGESGINITLAYLATNTRIVFAADDLAAAKAALA